MISKNDLAVIHQLAAQVAEIAALPIQEEKRSLWRKLNAREAVRPMVMIDQVCWNEMNIGDELTLQCIDPECQGYEEYLRRTIYQWKYFPVDMVVEPFIRVPKAIQNTGFGILVQEHTIATDFQNEVLSRKYENQFQNEEDIEKIQTPLISHDPQETERRLSVAQELFDGTLEVKAWGYDPYLSLWDPLATWMGVENALFAMMDKPDYIHCLLSRMTDGYMRMLDQLETEGLLCQPQSLIHCTGAYTDELPAQGYDPAKPRPKDIWMFGLAQIFSSVSPKMFREFEVEYCSQICARFGLVYYGCCDPLDKKMKEVRLIPNVRKVSMSPWTDQERGAAELGRDFVFSRKPNPALLAGQYFDPEEISQDLRRTIQVCEQYGCSLEIILKDISTVGYHPERLFEWSRIAMQLVEN